MAKRKARSRYQPQQPATIAGAASSTVYWGGLLGTHQYGIAGTDNWPSNTATNATGTGWDNFVSSSVCGKSPSVVAVGHSWQNSSGVNQTFANIKAQCDRILAKGAIPFITWSPQKSGDLKTDAAFKLSNITRGDFDSYIATYATDLKNWMNSTVANQLGTPIPAYLRFAHEMNSNFWVWCEANNGNSPGDFVAMWRHVATIVKANCPNATLVWCCNQRTAGSGATSITSNYPGDSYVDWVSIDLYNKDGISTNWDTFAQTIDSDVGPTNAYTTVTGLTALPMILGEVGCIDDLSVAGRKAAWITDMLDTQIPSVYTQINAFLWYNHDNYPNTLANMPANQGPVNLEQDTADGSATTAFKNSIANARYKAGSTTWLTSFGSRVIPATPP